MLLLISSDLPRLTIEYEYTKLGETRSTSGMYETDPSFFPWSDEYHDGTNGFEDVMGNKHNVEDDEYDGYNQPILADIIFDEKNHMYLSFMDRYGLQIGNYQHPAYSGSDNDKEIATGFGDMKKLCLNSGAWEMEAPGSATCPGGDENVYDTKRDPESNFFEDYAGDKMNHADSAGMALVKGNNQILRVVDDPHPTNDTGLDYITTAGINTYSLKTGAIENWYGVYKSGYQDPTFNGSKTAGLGDLELLTAPAPIEVGNRVWSDEDGNGIQDVGEVGIDGVKVELICNGTKVAEATTENGGEYIFSNDENGTNTVNHIYNILELQPNVDSCKIVIPNVSTQTPLKDKSASPTNQGNNRQIDSDGVMNGDSDEVAILSKDIANPGANNHTYDFGFSSSKESVSIGSFVWEDLNRNGLQDDNENGIADVNVTLLDENGTVMPNPVQKTGTDGQYYFSGLDEGTYSILVSPPSGKGYVPCTQQTTVDNNDTENDSNIATSNGNEYISGKFTLQIGTEPTESNGKTDTDSADDANDENGNMTVDFCFYRPASLGDRVWYDENQNGIQDANERGVEGVTVELLTDCSRRGSTQTTTTDADGRYKFTDLNAGDYCVEFSNLPDGYVVTSKDSGDDKSDSDASRTSPFQTETTTLEAGEEDLSWDMGIYSPKVAIGDRVWYDTNKNGQQDDGEEGVPNIEVKLLKDCTTEVNSTTTDTNGNYIFEELSTGTYCLEFGTLPNGYVISPQDIGDDKSDSDVNATTHKTVSVTLEDEARDLTWDMGIYKPTASIGDRVWYDENQNGIQDANETGVEGVTVELLTDCSRRGSTQTTTTDADGRYKFTDLNAGDYCVEFSNLPDGYVVTSKDSGEEESDSDASTTSPFQTETTTLEAGEEDLSWDMGIYKSTTSDNSSSDENSSTEDNNSDSNTSNEGASSDDNTTDDNSNSNVDNSTDNQTDNGSSGTDTSNDGASSNDNTTDDNSNSNTDNSTDNQTDNGSSGTDTSNDGASSNDNTTDDNSNSNTDNSTDNQTDNGNSGTDTSNDGASSSNDNKNNNSSSAVEHSRTTNQEDSNSETSTSNERTSSSDDSKNNNSSSAVEHSRTTNQEDSNSETSTSNERTSSSDDSKNNNSSSAVEHSRTTNQEDSNSETDTLSRGVLLENSSNSSNSSIYLVTQDNNSSNINSSTDNQTEENSSNLQEDNKTLSILGDRVWYDENHNGIQDSNENGVKDVKVVLYESDCTTAIKETRTDKNGKYLFRDLEANNYCIGFDELPLGYQFTPVYDNTGAGTELDCNVDPGTGKTSIINLPSATDDRRWDMGIVPKCKDEQDRVLQVFDDSVTASTTDSVTTINVLENDHGNLDIESIRLVTSKEAEILYENGTAVGGTTLETTDRLVVEGEGVWTILSDGTIKFKAEDGFTGVPTPIYYIVKCKQGSVSNVGKVTITSNCVCDTYEESSISVFTKISMTLLFLFSSILGAFLYRKELQELK